MIRTYVNSIIKKWKKNRRLRWLYKNCIYKDSDGIIHYEPNRY